MLPKDSPAYRFGPFRLDPVERTLFRYFAPVPITHKAFEILLVLVRNSGRVVEKDDLMREVWRDTFVEEGNLAVHMSALRKVLGEATGESAVIETVPRRGYRFSLPVEEVFVERPTLVIQRSVETHIVREEFEESVHQPLWSKGKVIVSVVCLVLLLGMAVGWRVTHRTAASSHALRVVPFASYPGEVQSPSFAPDGERIAFSWTGPANQNSHIYVKTIGNDPPL